jgi:hypothetical protein
LERSLANSHYEHHQESQHKLGIAMARCSCVCSVRWGSDVSDNKIKLNFELETRLAILVGNCVKNIKKVTKFCSERTSTNEKFNLSGRYFNIQIFGDDSRK